MAARRDYVAKRARARAKAALVNGGRQSRTPRQRQRLALEAFGFEAALRTAEEIVNVLWDVPKSPADGQKKLEMVALHLDKLVRELKFRWTGAGWTHPPLLESVPEFTTINKHGVDIAVGLTAPARHATSAYWKLAKLETLKNPTRGGAHRCPICTQPVLPDGARYTRGFNKAHSACVENLLSHNEEGEVR